MSYARLLQMVGGDRSLMYTARVVIKTRAMDHILRTVAGCRWHDAAVRLLDRRRGSRPRIHNQRLCK